MHPSIAAALISARRHTCICGAHSDEPYGYCRKCRARIVWRRRSRRPTWHRRRSARPSRRAARLFAAVLTSARPIVTRHAPGGDH